MSHIDQEPADRAFPTGVSPMAYWGESGCVPWWPLGRPRTGQGLSHVMALSSAGDNHGKAVRDLLRIDAAAQSDPVRYVARLLEELEGNSLITASERGQLNELFALTARKSELGELTRRFSVIRNGLIDDARSSTLASVIADIALNSATTVLVNPSAPISKESGGSVVGEDLRGAIAGAAVGAGFGLVGAVVGAVVGSGLMSAAAYADKKTAA